MGRKELAEYFNRELAAANARADELDALPDLYGAGKEPVDASSMVGLVDFLGEPIEVGKPYCQLAVRRPRGTVEPACEGADMHKTAAFIGLWVLFLDEAGRDETHPALVTDVHGDDVVNLAVFASDGHTYARTSVRAGDKPGQWKPLGVGIEGKELEAGSFELPPELRSALGDLAASLSSVGSSVSTLSSQVSSLSSQVSSLQSRAAELEAKNADLEAKLAAANPPSTPATSSPSS